MSNFRVYRPRLQTEHDWRLAYGLECIRIWKQAQDYKACIGDDLDIHFPTEEEFRASRRRSQTGGKRGKD